MYRDINEDDCMKFEKPLVKFESSSSTFIRDIWTGNDLSLTRNQLDDMKQFLAIMTYRGEHRRGQYYGHLSLNSCHVRSLSSSANGTLNKTTTISCHQQSQCADTIPRTPIQKNGESSPLIVSIISDTRSTSRRFKRANEPTRARPKAFEALGYEEPLGIFKVRMAGKEVRESRQDIATFVNKHFQPDWTKQDAWVYVRYEGL
ncbi:MAG: hypothetical protein J3Q66DRAFT_48945 [Benniella sp.]|nr:MAG: hypothetical protein J3Q66DRAFT_48945 [Benniella sp.]